MFDIIILRKAQDFDVGSFHWVHCGTSVHGLINATGYQPDEGKNQI